MTGTTGDTAWQRLLETAAIGAFAVLAAAGFYRLAAHASLPGWVTPLAALAGWMAADLFTGLVHWAFDSFGSVRTPVFGRRFVRPFREHHADTRRSSRCSCSASPGHWPKNYGTVKFQPPEDYLGQLAYPFRRRRGVRTPYG